MYGTTATAAVAATASFVLATGVHGSVAAYGETPVTKVITLLTDLKTEIEQEGNQEAGTYNTFGCFCKNSTDIKSSSIIAGNDQIGSLSAQIEEETASVTEKSTEVSDRKANHEHIAAQIDVENVRCLKEKADFEAVTSDLQKAVSTILKATTAMETHKDGAGISSFLQIRPSLERTLALADALGLAVHPKLDAVTAFLQGKVDPSNAEYAYHSEGVLETLNKLSATFQEKITDLTTEYGKTKAACDAELAALGLEMTNNNNAMALLDQEILGLQQSTALARDSLLNAETLLKDDEGYLKELTQRCEARASDWDQRSQMRANEIQAISGALAILTDQVHAADSEVNLRAASSALLSNRVRMAPASVDDAKIDPPARAALLVEHPKVGGTRRAAPSFLQVGRGSHANTPGAKRDRVVALLSEAGQRLRSTALASLSARVSAMDVAADPFSKVKQLIQELIERLLAEANSEATKKGFCDTEVGKAMTQRNFTFDRAWRLNTEVQGLEAKRDGLTSGIQSLSEALVSLNADLVNATALRSSEKDDNIATIDRAREGLTALTEAMTILKAFYKQAAKAKPASLAQKQHKASPVDADTEGAGFQGNYAGKQEASTGIIGLLEVIKSDFQRTISFTEEAEKQGAADFVQFERVAKADIAGKETKKTLDEEELQTTLSSIESEFFELRSEMAVLDEVLKGLEALQPTCVDTGMSYQERIAKREEEIAALKSCLVALAPPTAPTDPTATTDPV